MATRLIKKREGYAIVVPQYAKDREERGECPTCGKPKAEWKRSIRWRCCSKECTDKYWADVVIAHGWQALRAKAINRDGHKCVKCGAVPEEKRYVNYPDYKEHVQTLSIFLRFETIPYEGRTQELAVCIDDSQFVVDHIHAIALGGDEWDINNLQTLCQACNKIKTAEDAGKIAALRRKEVLVNKGQTFLSI